MIKALKKLGWKQALLIAVAVPIVLYVLWTTSRFVIAYQETRHAHIFPTQMQAEGWSASEQTKVQDLPPDATFTRFTRSNSAYIDLAASTTLPETPEIFQLAPVSTSTPVDAATSTLASSTPETVPTEPVKTDEATSTPEEDAPQPTVILEEAPTFPPLFINPELNDASSTIEEFLPEPDMLDPLETSTSTATTTENSATTTSSLPSKVLGILNEGAKTVASDIFSFLVPTVYATTTEALIPTTSVTTTPLVIPQPMAGDPGTRNVSTCRIIGSECRTMQFSGFGVVGKLTEKEFVKAEVNFSFAADAADLGLSDGKLYVRYFHAGTWRMAGEIFINEQMSNESNGGYFTSTLDEIQAWRDLDDLSIEVEFVRGDERQAVKIYMDSLWVDTTFRDRVQEILSGSSAAIDDSPENVSMSLNMKNSNDNTLVLSEIDKITFEYTDDLDDRLFMRADKSSYRGAGAQEAYISVTNTGVEPDMFTLNAVFPEGKGSITELWQYLRNVATTSPEPERADISYFCESGWQGEPGQSYSCPDDGDEHTCSSVNESGKSCFVANDIIGTHEVVSYVDDWVKVDTEQATSPDAPPGTPADYRITSKSSKSFQILPGQTLYFRVTLASTLSGPSRFALLATGETYTGDLQAARLQSESWLRTHPPEKKAVSDRGNSREEGISEFRGDENPEFKFTFKSKRGPVSRLFNDLTGRGNKFAVSGISLKRGDGTEADVPVAVEYTEDGKWSMRIKSKPRAFQPGRYTAEISMKEGSEEFTEKVDFYWGVLVLNVNASSYRPGEDVTLMMGALDQNGDTLCDAELRLIVTTPSGEARNLPVVQSQQCSGNNVVETADYLAHYRATETGAYKVELSELTAEGAVLHRITDSFKVEASSPFTIRRSGATRIYPVADYSMDLEIVAVEDFTGEFVESIPQDFIIVDYGGAEVRMYGAAKNLVWPLEMRAGETKRFRYIYDAPDISPYLYMLGPVEIKGTTGMPFSEGRQWSLASDATGNMLLYWDQTYIPTGWTCVSCLSSDVFYQRFVVGSSTAGQNGGAATHTHTASGSAAAASGGTQAVDDNNQATPVVAHTHASFTPTIGTASNLPAYRHLAVIQYNSTGNPSSLPAGAIAMFDIASSSLPAGWYRYANQDGRFIRAESTSTVGTIGGANTHTHTITGTTGNAASTIQARNPGTSVAVAANAHNHTINTNTASDNNIPPYREVLLARLSATSTGPDGMIAMWSGDPASGWSTVSSSTEAFEDRFFLASTTYGAIGGASTSTHADVNGVATLGPSATVNRDSTPGDINVASASHTHTVDVTGFSTNVSLPPYRSAVFAKRAGGESPPQPTIYNPFDNEKSGTSTPYFEFTTTDPDGTDSLIYEFQYDDDSDLETSPLADRTSDVETGCTPDCFENRTSGGDTSPFNEGERIRFSLGNLGASLDSGTTYYWRVRAKESPLGSWGTWSTTTSYTYVSGVEPSQWFETEDGQFNSGTFSGTETDGSDSITLTTAPPFEVMLAYGESTVQVPRYRLWDGSQWGAEQTDALNIGGTIQWAVVKGATTRDEFILGTQDASNDVNVQVYDGAANTWGDLQEVIGGAGGVADNTARGFDVAYETTSGDALVVYCDGNDDPSYYVWNGGTWVSGGTISITSASNCEWIKLASDPLSDEIIMVERDIGFRYEAQVWDGNNWGNAKLLGSTTDTLHEGVAIEYEESGNQALVVTGNGSTAGFVWSTWDGTSWGINATQGLGDDFEWGRLRRDAGSDNISLCYIDQDVDMGELTWDGNSWETYSAAGDERETSGNNFDGKPVDCAYETTAGRDGYVMYNYATTTSAGYQVFDTSVWSSEGYFVNPLIEDSWTVGTVRAGDGIIHTFFHDDATPRIDVTNWNGSSWAARNTVETSPSVTVSPFLQPVDMAPRVYESNSGTYTGGTIDFDDVPGRSTWGDILWTTTEPSGSDVKLQVMYDSGSGCSTLVPDGTIPGNSTGLDVSSSPLNISGLSTTTYNRICLKATLSTNNANLPTLDDWTVTWERQPLLMQEHFRWYANATASLTPTDAWPSGGTDLAADTAIPQTYAPISGDVLRLRLSVLASSTALVVSDLQLKLQYAAGSSCSASMNWLDVGEIGSTTAAWRGHDNGALSDGSTLPSVLLPTAEQPESYEEENNSALNPNALAVGEEGEWDWVLEHNAQENLGYCFRAVTSGGEEFGEYNVYPSLVTNSAPETPTLEKPFDYEALASTTPWFEFVSSDVENNEITYQIQVDDDALFGSPNIDRDSFTFFDEFSNIVTPADKDPFIPAQSVRFIPITGVPLSDGTTYYWHVRAKDRSGSNAWSDWSATSSFTVDTSVLFSTWRQTTYYQFLNNTHDSTEATTTGGNDTMITPPATAGTTTAPLIDFDWLTTGNSWSSLSWNDNETSSDIKYRIEFFDGSDWAAIPETDLTGNDAGFDNSPLSLLSLNTDIYNMIRPNAVLTNSGASPRLQDWTVSWGLSVESPTLLSLFDNEKTPTTTPTFSFYSNDPQADDLVYQISISSTSPPFTSSTTRISSFHAGFTNTSSSTDSTPFESGDTVSFTLQPGDALTNGITYWWRVRAIDPNGGNAWSAWSTARSFTVDTSVNVSTWFQTTTEQFDTDTLSTAETNSGTARVTSIIREAFVTYAEGAVQTPRFRIWNGSSWTNESSAVSVGDVIRFAEAAAATTRDEYIIGTQGATGGINVQIVDGATDVAGNKVSMGSATGLTMRGFDVGYETTSGDAIAIACYGTEAVYRVWDGGSWSATSSIPLSITNNCQWVKMASDPVSEEIIAIFRDTTLGANDYEAYVWDGDVWGNATTTGAQVTANSEGMAVEYEESGGQAIVAVSNGANNSFIYTTWSGGVWANNISTTIGNDFAGGRLVRDVGSDNMAMCYIDIDTDIGVVRWDGSAFQPFQEFETTGNTANGFNGRPVTCEFETTTARDGYINVPYSDSLQGEYVYWDGGTLQPAALLSTIQDSWELRSARTGDNNILVMSYDDAGTNYDFTYWNGSIWSTVQQLEATAITTVTPATVPLDIVARRYPTFTSGSVESTDINFLDGSGIKWGYIFHNKTTPGGSSVAIQLEYYHSASSTWDLVPDSALSGNSLGSSTSPIDLTNLDFNTYANLRLKANFICAGSNCPTLNDWTLTWSPGITVSGNAKLYDETTNVTSGTVAIAINGSLQVGKTATISGGTWSIPNIRAFAGDVITVFISGATDTNESVGVTVYDGTGDITGMHLFQRHLALGSDDNATITNTDIGRYDNSISGNEDIFHDVDAGNDLSVCTGAAPGCFPTKLYIKSSNVFRPDSASSGNVTTRDLSNDGTIVADGNTITVSGSWRNAYVFTKNTSSVVFTATSTSETVDNSIATTSAAFNTVTFGQTSGAAVWSLSGPLSASSTLSINFGTLNQNGANPINLSGDLSIGAGGIFAKGSATTTFMGSGSNTWTDSSASKQDMGTTSIDGTSKTITLGSSVKATNIWIGSDDTLNAGGANTVTVVGDWLNYNTFTPQTGTVAFIASTTGRTITPGSSSFYNLTFNGGNGNWAFSTSSITVSNNFTIATGTVTMPTATTTVGGNWDTWTLNGSSFQHNNGTVLFNSTASGKTVRIATTTAFYDVAFNGSGGAWSFVEQNATTSRTITISAGTVTMPAGTFAIGGSLSKTGGTLTSNNGTLKFFATDAQTISLGGSNAFNMTFNGINGGWTFTDTNATSSGTFRIENGTTTMPSGSLGVGGSFLNVSPPSSGFTHNSGIVRFVSTASGNTVLATGSNFFDLVFNGIGGSWTISGSATSTRNTAFTQANSITLSSGRSLEIDGTFTNALSNASTTWTGATLYLNSGTTYAINSKGVSGDTYDQLTLGNGTHVSSWNSSVASFATTSTASFYSQNNASSSGSLYIYGNFATSSNVFWDYARDFDGVSLVGAGQRQVNVKIASSSIVTLTGSSSIQGIATASTTVANQGTGFYTLSIAGGTTTARYYSFASTTPLGVQFTGPNTAVSTLDNGEFVLTSSGSAAVTITGEVIDKNPQLQILYTRFATTTGVVTAFNVNATSTPTTPSDYWWFKNGYGNLYGEDFDNDIGPVGITGNPGWAQFDDSGITVNISGRVYADHSTTPMGAPVCDGSTPVVVVRTSGGLSYSGPCDGSGDFSIPSTFTTSNILTVYLNTNGGARAAAITKNVTAAVSNMDLYQNAVIIRQFDTTPTSIADMSFTDSTDDADIPFTATSSLMVSPETELYVWTGKAFSPGGDVVLQSGGSGDARDGRLYLATSSAFTLSGAPNFALGGGVHIDSGATFTTADSTFVFTATTTGKALFGTQPMVFKDIVFNGTGGQWLLLGTSTATTTMRTMTLSSGTVAGTGDVDVWSGGVTGNGTISMTGGTFLLEGSGNFGNSNQWQFANLTFGTSTTQAITKTGAATTTVSGVLRIAPNMALDAGTSANHAWVLSGAGTPFVINGTFNALGVPFFYTSSSATNITATTYGPLYLAPASGSPTYTLLSGNLTPYHLIVGNGSTLTATAATNDPNVNIVGDLVISTGATYIASDAINSNIQGSWTNSGTFNPSGRLVIFDATTTGKTINPGNSSFYDIQFNGSGGGWTIVENATTTNAATISAAADFTLQSGKSLEVRGTFTNSVASSSQTWTGSTLYLNSGTSYSMNAKSSGNATYGQLTIGANTNIRNWNSYAANITTGSSASLYAQNFASSSGKLYIWGAYVNSSGSDYWDYATDFDGTDISATPRKVDVYIASSSSATFSGGLLDIIGSPTASTTIQVQGSGAYSWNVSGGTLNAQYYEVRHTDPDGLNLTGYPSVTGLSNGDFLMSSSSNSSITLAGTVISANPLKVIQDVRFATSTGVVTGYNVTAVSATSSYWKFNRHYGNLAGEQYDNDPGGDPGFVRWDNSNDHIAISGRVYSDEGSTVSAACDNSTQVVRLKVQGAGSYTASCASGTGAYSFPDVGFNPGDTLTLYLASSSIRSATVSRGPTASIADMDIYEHRVILRHEDATPLTIAHMNQYDSGQDSNVPFLATDSSTDTLVVEPNTKVIVWTGKTFAPAGNFSIQSGSGTAWDGTLELFANSTLSASGAQSHSVGGSFLLQSGAAFSAANSTLTFTATTTGKTITPGASTFYNVVFDGVGGNWAFSAAATSTNDFVIATGTVTLPTSILDVGGSFLNTGGAFQHNNGTVKLTSTASEKAIMVRSSPFYDLLADGAGGSWRFVDGLATTSNDFTIVAGTLRAPTSTLAVGGDFSNLGTFTSNSGTVRMTATLGGKTIHVGGSTFYSLAFSGVGGGWSFDEADATTTRDFIVATGTVSLPTTSLGVGGSFVASSTFYSNSNLVRFAATTTGFSISVATSTFGNILFDSAVGGWTIQTNATSTGSTTISNAASLTLQSGRTLEVNGAFLNSAGAATTWTGSYLYLNSGTEYSVSAKSAAAETYGQITVGANTKVRTWNSTAATTSTASSASLYSQNDGNVPGTLYIYGAYTRTSGTDYWSGSTDFDGADISGSPRQAQVRIATSSSVVFSGGSLSMVGSSTASTTVYASGTTGYGFAFSGGTLNASYYDFKNLDENGLVLTGLPTITSLSNGDFELSVASGTLISLAATVVDANANLVVTNVKMASTSANTKGYNVMLTTTPGSFWTFTGGYGNIYGESFDLDGAPTTLCGRIRWDDSDCQFVNEAHYRWRNDNGGEGADPATWHYDSNMTRRKKVAISNPNATSYADLAVKLVVDYDSDMQSDFDDVRFTDSSGTTSIPYWRETTVNSASTTVWVKVPFVSSNGSADVYMYYGHAATTSADSGTNTFSFFDDFEDNNISEYSGDTGVSPQYFQTSASFNHNGTYGLAGSGISGQTNTGIYRTGSQSATGRTIRWFQYVNADVGVGFDNDEPCTLFGIQNVFPTINNFAVCLEEFPDATKRVSIARNVRSRDSSGTVMATTSAAWSTGWYEVVTDWTPTSTIKVSVYNAAGNLFAYVSTTSTAYSSGGIGFAHFNQNGGWDTFMIKAYTQQTPTYLFGTEQLNGGATWKAAENTPVSGVLPNENIRLRFSIQNTGTAVTNHQYRLQYAPKAGAINCESVPTVNYNDVPVSSLSCGAHAACMKTSSQFTDLASTSPSLSYLSYLSFTPGYMLEDPSNTTNGMALGNDVGTEVEYNFQITNNASQTAYCFRVSNGGTDLANYDRVAEVNIAFPPYISDLSLNSAQNINLDEGTSTIIYATSTVTDNNGYSDISFATSTIYRSGVSGGAACTADENNCYQSSAPMCALSNCSGNSCTLSCVAYVQYFAEPTDAGTFSAQNWLATIAVQDASGYRDTQTSLGVEMNTLRALSVITGDIDFGALEVGQNTGTTNATTTARNTGNVPIDIDVSGTALLGSTGIIATSSQIYATTTFAYGSCSICQFLSGTASPVNVNVSKPTSTSTAATSSIYFGITIPTGVPADAYSGVNTFTAVAPNP